jgi:nitrile hydratase
VNARNNDYDPSALVIDQIYPIPADKLPARTKALEELLIGHGLLTQEAIDRVTAAYEQEISPLLGAQVVAHAWSDPTFKEALLSDATEACRSLGIGGLQGEYMVAVENTATVHNVVVCTLCSCYPWPVLGLPPKWYKYPEYRAQIVMHPRLVLKQTFGLDLPPSVEIRVWDSSSEIRYFVLPQRPSGTEDLSESELIPLVRRELMIGVAR